MRGRRRHCRCARFAPMTAGAKIHRIDVTTGPSALAAESNADRLMRADHLYDFIVEIDHNTRPRVSGRGSAVFLHLARPGFAPTAGCIAMTRGAMLRLLARLSRRTRIVVG